MKILGIDDDHSCRLTLARCLSYSGEHTVEVAGGGAEGLKKAAELKPDLIILDLRMPDMDGTQVLAALAAAPDTRNIPVVILTGATLDELQREELKRHPNFLLLAQKPCVLKELLKEAVSLIRREGAPARRVEIGRTLPEAA